MSITNIYGTALFLLPYRIIEKQEILNRIMVKVKESKSRVQDYLREQDDYFKKKREREGLKMRIALLQKQLQRQGKVEKEGMQSRDHFFSFSKELLVQWFCFDVMCRGWEVSKAEGSCGHFGVESTREAVRPETATGPISS